MCLELLFSPALEATSSLPSGNDKGKCNNLQPMTRRNLCTAKSRGGFAWHEVLERESAVERSSSKMWVNRVIALQDNS